MYLEIFCNKVYIGNLKFLEKIKYWYIILKDILFMILFVNVFLIMVDL